MADQRNPLLRRSQRGPPRHHRRGPGAVQVRQHCGRREREAAVRPVLHQEHVARTGYHDYVPDHQNCAARPGGAMKWLFWVGLGVIAYTYFGYPVWLWIRTCWRPRTAHRGAYEPFVSVVMIVRNEAGVVDSKLRNLLALNYPPQLSEIVVLSDGSTDGTNELLREYASDPRVRIILIPESRGKAAGLNEAMNVVRGDIVVFTDARQKI